ncbi:MAG: hypothetical protein ABSD88_03120 [Candidatus Korobacteraceae bacterium]|jgi:hypothetical protein
MPTTLFDYQPYDPARERRKRLRLIGGVVLLLIIAALAWFLRYWPEERRVDRFFAALQAQNYEQAYAVWLHDPEWKQHAQQYARYPFSAFYQDWGPQGEYGVIKSYHIEGTAEPPVKGGASGVVVVVTVNQRPEKAHIWVEKESKTLSFSPY